MWAWAPSGESSGGMQRIGTGVSMRLCRRAIAIGRRERADARTRLVRRNRQWTYDWHVVGMRSVAVLSGTFSAASCGGGWDHLPSQAVRRRGQQKSGEGQTPNQCDHCQRPCEGTTWHVIAECEHAELVAAREQGRERITQTLDDIERARGPTQTTSLWREAFSMADGKWASPPEWRDEQTKAGEVFNPWYGLFPPHWLDGDRWQEKGDGYSHWTGAVSELRKLGQTALEACHGVWILRRRGYGVTVKGRRTMRDRAPPGQTTSLRR